MFKICARTVLELGAELISSDVIAFYELIKNAFDAGSPNGVEIRFEIVLRKNDYLKLRAVAEDSRASLARVKSDIEAALDVSASKESLNRIRHAVGAVNNMENLIKVLDAAYAAENRIVVSDTGTGMSSQDLVDNYLVIGTASRKRAINKALDDAAGQGPAPFLGEKGIGRLSVMRLGGGLTVETAQKRDKQLNLLHVDWSAFDSIDAMLDEIDIKPELGGEKPSAKWSGTKLIVSSLDADWTRKRVEDMARLDFARLFDPFEDIRRRPRVAIFWNGERLSVAHMNRMLIDHAHAALKGRFFYKKSQPILECEYEARDLGFPHPLEKAKEGYESSITGLSREIPFSALHDLGEFEFEAYWYNRQRLAQIDSIGDRSAVRDLQKHWSGVLLFRDGFRVLPYGNEEDDWLNLDRRALGSSGYLLNKAQLVGRVNISRLGNPSLVDQTNREGLRVCPEQQALVEIMTLAVRRFRGFLKDVGARHKGQPRDIEEARTHVPELERRAKAALKAMRKLAPDATEIVNELQNVFDEIKVFFDNVKERVTEVESENRQMIQLAGVGLMVEVVAHELARSSEHSLSVLETLNKEDVPDQAGGLLNSLRAEMKSVSKRLRVLDPLSVSGRQRKETFSVEGLIGDIISAHEQQFARHGIKVNFDAKTSGTPVRIRAVKGMLVQIFENLVANSIYWLALRKQAGLDFQPQITIKIGASPLTVSYEDNGTGVAVEYREKVFEPFFSLKERSNRRGLGLYIARDCAEYHGGTLALDGTINRRTGRLHRFILKLPNEVLVS